MKGSDIFPSKYIKSDDLNGKDHLVTIDEATMEKLGDDQKLILYFDGKDKGMVCNKTNFDVIAYLYGDETDDWKGKKIVLTTELVRFQNRTVPGLRVRAPKNSKTPTKPVKESENPAADMDDEIPF